MKHNMITSPQYKTTQGHVKSNDDFDDEEFTIQQEMQITHCFVSESTFLTHKQQALAKLI